MISQDDDKPKAKVDNALMAALQFTEADLEMNRRGRLSTAQRQILNNKGEFGGCWVILIAPIFIGITLNIVRPNDWGCGCFGAAICFVFLLIGYAYDDVVGDASAGQVTSVEGTINLRVDRSGPEAPYIVEANGINFKVEKSAFLAFKNRETYVLYYTPRSKRIVAAEWLR